MTMKRHVLFYLYFGIIIFIISCTIGGSPRIRVEGVKFVTSSINRTASAFMLIINDGNGNDTLIGCSVKDLPSAQCELHDFVNGRMQKVEGINIPAKEIIALKRGGLHLMLFNLPDRLGNGVTLILIFKRVGKIEVELPVEHSEHIHH
ncbi:MAG: hypothetical protein Fur0020_08610 [Thermodesulfovibrionia bacterium]